jgi:hypothetical protein
VVRKLQLLLPGIKIWLDVDHLEDLGKLEEAVADAAVFIIFLLKGYFCSVNCRRELYAAFASNRPIVVIREVDEDKGGATIEVSKMECRTSCIEENPDEYPTFLGPEEAVRRVFGHEDPVVWVRPTDFQVISLKAIASRILSHLLHYTKYPSELAAGFKLAGELGPIVISKPITLLVCDANAGARALAEEISHAATAAGASAGTSPVLVEDAAIAVMGANLVTEAARQHSVLLVYLTKDTFLDDNGVFGSVVQRAMDMKIQLVLVHEQEASQGACAFSVLFGQIPDFLLKPPYKIFDRVAVPLYSSPVHREISLRRVLKDIGGFQKGARTAHTAASSYRTIPSLQQYITSRGSRTVTRSRSNGTGGRLAQQPQEEVEV